MTDYFKGGGVYHKVYFAVDSETETASAINGTACYSSITYGGMIKSDTKNVWIIQPIEGLSYTKEAATRWLDDLNEIGFPNHLEDWGEYFIVRLDLSEFKGKIHLSSTLMLIRVLWETGANRIPDLYFKAMDANPQADKFTEIQKAHKDPVLSVGTTMYSYLNRNHIVTSDRHKGIISKEELFKRFLAGPDVKSPFGIGTSIAWDVASNKEE